jgi:hypothetical protein
MRISVDLDDDDFVSALVATLREEGHLVVEPEIAELRISRRRPPPEGIRIEYASRPVGRCPIGVTALLRPPVTVRRLTSAVRRLIA